MIATSTLWIVIISLGLGSFGLRFMFTGLIGDKQLPEWVLLHLRYTAVAVLPGLIAPMVLWPAANHGNPDPARLAAAFVTVAVGMLSKNVLAAIICGASTLFLLLRLLG